MVTGPDSMHHGAASVRVGHKGSDIIKRLKDWFDCEKDWIAAFDL